MVQPKTLLLFSRLWRYASGVVCGMPGQDDAMDQELKRKSENLLQDRRVMTLAVSDKGIPWSSPVYFVFHDRAFYFFSNEASKHVLCALDDQPVAASVFNDSDKIDEIFGFQMSGRVQVVSGSATYLRIVKKYVTKFNFLKKIFGPQIIENRRFFQEKFKSQLYCFVPETVVLSDNSQSSGKRRHLDLNMLVD